MKKKNHTKANRLAKSYLKRIHFASTALMRGELDQFNSMIELIKQDIDALDERCIAVKDNWRVKHEFGALNVLQQFAPTTKKALLEKIAPLMQWRNIQGQGEAIKWDLDVVNAQQAALSQPERQATDCHYVKSAKIIYALKPSTTKSTYHQSIT